MKVFKYIVSNYRYIINAYIKYVFDVLCGRISKKTKKRRAICRKCQYKKFGLCLKCGCVLAIKTNIDYIEDKNGKALDGCPIGKW